MMQPSLALSSAFALAPDSRVEPGMVFDDQPMRLQSGAAAARPSNAEAQGQADALPAGEVLACGRACLAAHLVDAH